MTLYNNPASNSFWSQKSEDSIGLKQRMETHYAQSITLNQSFWAEADIDTRFKAGDQELYNEVYGNLPGFRKRSFSFNRIRRVCNMVTGYQRKNRKSTIVIPLQNSDEETADQFSKVVLWAMENDNTLNTISEAFDGAITTGMNLLSVWMDYRSDPISGDIRVDNLSYSGFLIDPFFTKKDLSDCNFIWTRKYLTKMQINSLLPDKKDEIDKISNKGRRDGKFQFMAETYSSGMEDLIAYDEYWYLDHRMQKIVVDTSTGETLEWEGSPDDLKKYLDAYPELTFIENEIPTCKLGILVDGKVMYHGQNPMGIDVYPFVVVLGYYEPQVTFFPLRVQGLVRGIRDSQYLYNRKLNISLSLLESTISSGWKYKENALVNPEDVFLSGEGRGLALKSEAQMSDVEQILPPQVPPSMIELTRMLADETNQISGVNEELLGSADDDKSGILSMLRQGAGLVTLQTVLDQLDASQKYLGDIFVFLIQANFSPGKIQQIIGEKPAPLFYRKAFGKYKSAIEEGLNTTTQRQMQFRQLLELKELGIPVPTELLLKTSTLQNKKELIEAIKKQEEQSSQQQQQEQQMKMQILEAQIADLKGKSTANSMLGAERASRINENAELAVERRAKSIEDLSSAQLNRAKTLKELEGIDLSHLQSLLQMVQVLKATGGDAKEAEAAVSDDEITNKGQRVSQEELLASLVGES